MSTTIQPGRSSHLRTSSPPQAGTPATTAAPAAETPKAAGISEASRFDTRRTVGTAQPAVAKASVFGDKSGSLDLASPAARAAIEKGYAAFTGESEGPNLSLRQRLVPRDVTVDPLGKTHVRFDRMHEGIPVMGEQVIAHFEPSGALYKTTGHAPATLPAMAEREGSLTGAGAVQVALAKFAAQPDEAPTARKVLVKDAKGTYRPAFDVTVKRYASNTAEGLPPAKMRYVVDANSGEILKSWNAQPSSELHAAKKGTSSKTRKPPAKPAPKTADPATAKRNDKSLYSDLVNVESTVNAKGRFELRTVVDGVSVITQDAKNLETTESAVEFTDNNDLWGEGRDSKRQAGAVDAHFAAVSYVRMLKDLFGRNSIDDKGMPVKSFVHIGELYNNAYYTEGAMHYGDGDGVDLRSMTSVDIGGHEPGHYLTEVTWGGEYAGQSGGGNESFSDVLGFLLEYYVARENPALSWDFKMGEDVVPPGSQIPNGSLRDMDDPTTDGMSVDHISNYTEDLDVHFSSGIPNKAFAMAIHGGTNRTSGLSVAEGDGIGVEKAAQAWFRGYTTYCTPTSTFEEQWKAVVQGAIDLYGKDSKEVQVINASWNAGMRLEEPKGLNV